MSKHTPGKWSADPKRLTVQTSNGEIEGPVMSYLVGNQGTGPGMTVSIASERHADHYLCAAAPELLAACESMLATCGGSQHWNGETHESLLLIEAAIARAKGQA